MLGEDSLEGGTGRAAEKAPTLAQHAGCAPAVDPEVASVQIVPRRWRYGENPPGVVHPEYDGLCPSPGGAGPESHREPEIQNRVLPVEVGDMYQ